MRCRRLYRMLALPLCLWFVAYATDAGGIDACPMHSPMAQPLAAAGAAAHRMDGMAGMAMPYGEQVPHGPADAPSQPPMGPMHCTCMGACCGGAIAPLPAPPDVATAAVVTEFRVAPMVLAHRRLRSVAQFLLPPANGPPALHTV